MVEFYLCCILKQPLIRLEGHIYLQGRYTFLQGIYLQDDSHLANKTRNRMKIGNGTLAEKKFFFSLQVKEYHIYLCFNLIYLAIQPLQGVLLYVQILDR